MEREDFMKKARLAAKSILDGKENGIMNLVQQAWAEGKRNAEVETLRAAIDEALDRRDTPKPVEDAVYPTWREWLQEQGVLDVEYISGASSTTSTSTTYVQTVKTLAPFYRPIPADVAVRLGIEPKYTKQL